MVFTVFTQSFPSKQVAQFAPLWGVAASRIISNCWMLSHQNIRVDEAKITDVLQAQKPRQWSEYHQYQRIRAVATFWQMGSNVRHLGKCHCILQPNFKQITSKISKRPMSPDFHRRLTSLMTSPFTSSFTSLFTSVSLHKHHQASRCRASQCRLCSWKAMDKWISQTISKGFGWVFWPELAAKNHEPVQAVSSRSLHSEFHDFPATEHWKTTHCSKYCNKWKSSQMSSRIPVLEQTSSRIFNFQHHRILPNMSLKRWICDAMGSELDCWLMNCTESFPEWRTPC